MRQSGTNRQGWKVEEWGKQCNYTLINKINCGCWGDGSEGKIFECTSKGPGIILNTHMV